MTSLRAALGHPVVAKSNAEQLGQTTGVAVNPASAHIVAVHVGGSKGSARFVPWEQVTSFGTDAVMVHDASSVHETAGAFEQRVADGEGDLLGKRLLTDTGDELGAVDDVEFDAADGRLESLQVAGAQIAADRLLGIGAYAVVVRAEETA
jgi:uncharacterized protein YrrD